MGYICPIGRGGVNYFFFFSKSIFMKHPTGQHSQFLRCFPNEKFLTSNPQNKISLWKHCIFELGELSAVPGGSWLLSVNSQKVVSMSSICLTLCLFVDQVMSPHHSDQMSQRPQVSRIAPLGCSLMEVQR